MIAIIPARGGSKRIKMKNIKLFNGKPIISWIIKELKKNKKIKKIVVSSDNQKILNISKKFGAKILIKRSNSLSNDKTPFQKVIVDVIKKLNLNKNSNEKILVVYPCAVFFKSSFISKAEKLLNKNKKNFIMSVCEFNHPIQRAFKIHKNKLKFFSKKYQLFRTQDLIKSYFDAGQFYLGFSNTWLKKKVHLNSVGITLPQARTIDIDSIDDWKFAEKISKVI